MLGSTLGSTWVGRVLAEQFDMLLLMRKTLGVLRVSLVWNSHLPISKYHLSKPKEENLQGTPVNF